MCTKLRIVSTELGAQVFIFKLVCVFHQCHQFNLSVPKQTFIDADYGDHL